jgi:hypothetical protein
MSSFETALDKVHFQSCLPGGLPWCGCPSQRNELMLGQNNNGYQHKNVGWKVKLADALGQ